MKNEENNYFWSKLQSIATLSNLNKAVFTLGLVSVCSIVFKTIVYYNNQRKLLDSQIKECKSEQTVNPILNELINQIEEEFNLSVEYLKNFKDIFKHSMNDGLASNDCCLKMQPSYITRLPIKEKIQSILALDVGGTNIRVMLIEINHAGKTKYLKTKKSKIPKNLLIESSAKLFEFIAECIKEFLGNCVVDTSELKLGFTFSFPLIHNSINSAILIEWTKEFSSSDLLGTDIAATLNKALSKLKISTTTTAILNDAVGALLCGAYETGSKNCVIGLILGTGFNASYMESSNKIIKLINRDSDKMIVNIEWGNFDSPHGSNLPRTKYDTILNQCSINPDKQVFEKLISGTYMSEIFRLVLKHWSNTVEELKFLQNDQVFLPYTFETRCMSEMEADSTKELDIIDEILKKIGIENSSYQVRQVIKRLCACVSRRSASLVGAAICAIVDHMERKDELTIVSVDGSVFNYTGYRYMVDNTIKSLGYEKVFLVQIQDGSGKGAALAAATVDNKQTVYTS